MPEPEKAVVLEWKGGNYHWVPGLDLPMAYSEAEAAGAALPGHFIPVPLSRILEKGPLEARDKSSWMTARRTARR